MGIFSNPPRLDTTGPLEFLDRAGHPCAHDVIDYNHLKTILQVPNAMKLTHTQASLLAGASTVFAIFPQVTVAHYTRVITPLYRPQASSLMALRSDWLKIGADIQRILEQPSDVQNPA